MSENIASVQVSRHRPLEARDSAVLWVQRLSLAAGGLAAVGLAPTEAQAAIVYKTTPVSLTGVGQAGWDIDGVGGANFKLVGFIQGAGETGPLNMLLSNLPGNSAIRVGNPYPGALSNYPLGLAPGNVVGPTAIGGGNWGLIAGFLISDTQLAVGAATDWPTNLAEGLNYFGFRFGSVGNYNYGWAQMRIDPANQKLEITQWAYETTPNQSIAVPGPLGLAGLAAGAAWSRKLRRRIREAG